MVVLNEVELDKLSFFDTTDNTVCPKIEDNTFRDGGLYCWLGIVDKEPDFVKPCRTTKICSPYSYTDARSKFCDGLGCTPGLYINPDLGEIARNPRGGDIVKIDPKSCTGVDGALNCLLNSLGQSFTNLKSPSSPYGNALVGFFGFAIVAIIALKLYRKGKR